MRDFESVKNKARTDAMAMILGLDAPSVGNRFGCAKVGYTKKYEQSR